MQNHSFPCQRGKIREILHSFHFFRGLNKPLMPKAPELSRFSRLRFENLAGLPQRPNMECPRVTYDSSGPVPAFWSSLRVQIRKVETSVTRCPNVAAASLLELRNVSNALGTPASLPTPSDRFWGGPAGCTRRTFDNFSDFRFLHFLHWFSFKFHQRAPFGF